MPSARHRARRRRNHIHRSGLGIFAAVAALVAASAPAALADSVANNIDGSIDSVAEVMALNVGGSNGSTQFYVNPTNGDGKNGCNLTGSTTLVVSVSSSNASVATVSPSTLTFSACGDIPTLTVTPHNQGSATISLSEASNNTAASFDLTGATFTANVAPPANTGPSVSISGVSPGASYDKGSVPPATCDVIDAEDGNSSFPATLSDVTGPYTSDGIGSQTASCSYTDGGGLMDSDSVTYSIGDPTKPVIGYTLNPALPDGLNDWFKSDVTLTWTVTEDESPNSLQPTGCEDQTITADQTEQTYSCSATSAGGSASQVDVKIKRDGTGPVVSYTSATGTAGNDGWYTSDVTATFTATDVFSGPSSQTATSTSTGEGAAVQVSSPAFSDLAGNTTAAGAATEPFKIDKSGPTGITISGVHDYYYGAAQTTPVCSATDSVSGMASCVVTGGGTEIGSHTWTATATDKAGNSSTETATYNVTFDWHGFFAPVDNDGVLNTIKGGQSVPLKWNIPNGSGGWVSSLEVVKSVKQGEISCSASAAADDVEATTTGGTSLRYDTAANQYIYNWQSPKTSGKCYSVNVTLTDGTSHVALFKTK